MCKDCTTVNISGESLNNLAKALNIHPSKDGDYEPSEPFTIGGPAGIYPFRAPFIGDCQYKLDLASCGNSAAQILVSSTRHPFIPSYLATDQGTGENSAIDGVLINLPANSTPPVGSDWYNIRNSENTIYVTIAGTVAAAYVTMRFRQKR